ncbi:hypothetical protein [Biformimicrobium ophioploci]|uniref:Transporter n=1 Tax=Biformimicrobium ophioploci TaxID=3036711 RepID=A0ABQ6M0I8_9GAMM|nr:hypothetical protein [Microbulbifer sp. NKW57]GMG87802.1 transporter [Microbulbifer sp. NKW57]
MNRSIFALLLAAAATNAQADEWKYTVGADVSSGEYGSTSETEITALPFSMTWSPSDKWSFKASVPWISIEGDGSVVAGGDGGFVVGRGNGNGNGGNQGVEETVERSSESGLGDIWLTSTYSLEPLAANSIYVDLSAKLKMPTGDEAKGLGTGEVDYSLQMEAFAPMGKWMPFVTVARKFKGDMPETELNDVWYTSVGSAYQLSGNTSFGASLDYQQATTAESDPTNEIFSYVSHKITPRLTGMLYGYVGLADGGPDNGFGVQFSYRPGAN